MKRLLLTILPVAALPVLAAVSCATGIKGLSSDECATLKTVPDSCSIDTLGITGTIFPKDYVYPADSKTLNPVSTWTPTKNDIMIAEEIFQRNAKQQPCLDSNTHKFYRQYAGQGIGNLVLIHGVRKSHDVTICGCRSFWINMYETRCSAFDALVNIRTDYCQITIYDGE
jgi:hypothetical protein